MPNLPTELDFSTPLGREASPRRMNQAMEYIVAKFRALEAVKPEYDAAIEQLRTMGLIRLSEVLAPIFDQSTAIRDTLQEIRDAWEADLLPAQVRADVIAAVEAEFADYRDRWHGARATPPTVRADGSAVAVGDMYFDTVLEATRVLGASGWKNSGSTVASIMMPFAITATAGQTVFAIDGGYDPGCIIVAKNGALLKPADFSATNGTSVTVAVGLGAGDILSGFAFGAITTSNIYTKTVSDARYRLIADSYTKAEVDGAITSKANAADVYSKSVADSRYLKAASNLSELTDRAAACTNLGLGSAAVRNDTYFAIAGHNHDGTYALAAHAHAATGVSFTPVGGISAVTVQAALAEVDVEKAGVGYIDAPQILLNAARTLALSDRGCHFYHDEATARVVTIPADATVPFGAGALVIIENEDGAGAITITAAAGVTIRWNGTSVTAGSRTLAAGGSATLMRVKANTWRLRGEGIS